MLYGKFLWHLWDLLCFTPSYVDRKLSNDHWRSFTCLQGTCLPNRNGVFDLERSLSLKTWIVLQMFQKRITEFQLRFWLLNLKDPNPKEKFWVLKDACLKSKDNHVGVLQAYVTAPWTFGTLSQDIYKRIVASMLRRVAFVLQAKGEPTGY